MEFRVLGPVEVRAQGVPVKLAAAKPTALLAAGLLSAGRVVSVEHLIDAIWPDPPATASALVQSYVSGLRRVLHRSGAPEVIVTKPSGYLFQVGAGKLDLVQFESMVAAARQAERRGELTEAADLLRAALALWRGPALEGLASAPLRAEAVRLDELRIVATEERIAVELRLGREAALVAEISHLVARYPLRERLRGQLMLALYRLGRQADALTVYREGAAVLSAELGLDPGHELRQRHEAILRADPALLLGAAAPSVASALPAVPAAAPTERGRAVVVTPSQLPAAVGSLAGRHAEVTALGQRLAGGPEAERAMVCAISGKAGSGKTALAVYVAHAARSAFPDGQLYASLRGIRGGSAARAGDVLGGFLRALGVSAAQVPDGEEDRASLYRSVIADRRVLILLDDAGSEAQVRPLLPGQNGCAVLVTSRAGLSGLEGAFQLGLDVLEPAAAIGLLTRAVGSGRVQAEPTAADEIVRLCGYLPLAVQTAGARLGARPRWQLSLLAERLRDERRRLDELSVGDLEVRASLALSYQGLEDQDRRAFRLLGLLGAPDFAPWVVAPLLDLSLPEAEHLVERLADVQLLDFAGNDSQGQPRYRMHDLIRLYAFECAAAEETLLDQQGAVRRLLQCWLALLDELSARMPSGLASFRVASGVDDRFAPLLLDRLTVDPAAWFAAERAALVAVVESGSALGLDETACDLAAALASSSFRLHNQFEEWWRTHDVALVAARRAGNRRGEATLLTGLGHLRYEQDRSADAHTYFHQALVIFLETDDLAGEAAALAGLGAVCREQGQLTEGLRYLERGFAAFQELDDQNGIASTSYDIGTVHREQGDFPAALAAFQRALDTYRTLGVRRGEALALRGIGLVHRAAGRLPYAAELFTQAIDIFRETGDRLAEAYGVQALAKVRIRQGDGAEVVASLLVCLDVCRELHDGFGRALMLRTIGELHLAVGALDLAETYLIDSLTRWDELAMPLFRARTLRDLALVHERRGRPAAALAAREEALAVFREVGSREYQELREADQASAKGS